MKTTLGLPSQVSQKAVAQGRSITPLLCRAAHVESDNV